MLVVVKNSYSNGGGLEKKIPEIMRFAGFNNIEVHRFLISKLSAFAEYHRRRGHRFEHLLYEYVIVGEKTGRRTEQTEQPTTEQQHPTNFSGPDRSPGRRVLCALRQGFPPVGEHGGLGASRERHGGNHGFP
ncbi:MAG: hypothetical protein QXM16_08200 [Nitrososphaerota archaeon]